MRSLSLSLCLTFIPHARDTSDEREPAARTDSTDLDRHLDLPERDLPLEAEFATLRLSLLLNIALASLKLGGSAAAAQGIKAASRALRIDGDPQEQPMSKRLSEGEKAKALYRRAMARVVVREEKEAVEDLEEAAKLQPEDAAIRKECVLCLSLSLSHARSLPYGHPVGDER